MTAAIDVSILVTTFERPRHLALALESIALQEAPGCRLEAVVSDDGSADDTAEVVAGFAARARFPVRFTSLPHDGFRLARARNAAARLAAGRYLIFLDGDCMIPRHHVAAHLARRRAGTALLGYCARLDATPSAGLDPRDLQAFELDALVPRAERRALARRRRRAWWHGVVRHPTKPRLAGGDFGVWRDDFARVNGFDERFVGWGQEDDDLGLRLRSAGVRLESILDRTASLHVWHPTDPTATRRWRDGANVGYFLRRGRLTACRRGIVERPPAAVTWGLPVDVTATPLGRQVARQLAAAARADATRPCEIDVVIRPGTATFARTAECRLVIAAPDATVESSLRRTADVVAVMEPDDDRALSGLLESVG